MRSMRLALAHRHGRLVHSHSHRGVHRHLFAPWASSVLAESHAHVVDAHGDHDHEHEHEHEHEQSHGHSHGLTDPSIVRSRAGIRAVALALVVLALTAAAQLVIYLLSGSVALLADLIHNLGDALTALPLGVAFFLRSGRGERYAGLAVVGAIFFSACAALYETTLRLIHPRDLHHLWLLAAAGAIGFLGNEIAAEIRLRAGRRLESPALIADGNHARTDGLVSLGVVASAILVAAGGKVADPIVGLAITVVILKITWDSWHTVRSSRGAWDLPSAGGDAAPGDRG